MDPQTNTPISDKEKIDKALEMIFQYSWIDGSHHKQWLLDQVVRALTDSEYHAWVTKYEVGEDGPKTYEWDEGINP